MIDIYYDGDCPFCSRYVRKLRLENSVGKVNLTNVREDKEALGSLQGEGFSLDEGMVVKYQQKYYSGADAVNILAMLGSASGVFNCINKFIFSSKILSFLLYPILRAGRNAALFMLGRERMYAKADTKTLDQYHIFAFLFGVFSIYHFIIYATSYRSVLYLSNWIYLVLGILLVNNPKEKRIFAALIITLLFDGWFHAPTASNHTMMLNFLIVAVAISGLWNWFVKRGSWQEFFEGFAPIGRWLLILMYFFGIFHKLNTGFLDPAASCATALMHKMPVISYFAGELWMQYAGIYSTYIIEGFVMVCLMVRRWHYYGVIVGVIFHMMLATSVYNSYLAFSSLSILLHTLFLPKNTLGNFRRSKYYKWMVDANNKSKQHYVIAGIFFVQLFVNMISVTDPIKKMAVLPWLCVFIPFVCFIIKYAKPENKNLEVNFFFSKVLIVNVLTVLFFLNCISPYLGLKTKQSVNMFANLQLEGGVSNHLVFGAPTLFPYLNDVVTIKEISKGSELYRYRQDNYKVVYYELLNVLEKKRDTVVTFERNGVLYENQSYETLKVDADKMLHPRWVRKWLYFNSVETTDPKPCSNYN